MPRLTLIALLLIVASACARPATSITRTTDTPRPATAIPQPTNTPAPDYRQMRTRLLTPLGALIVTVRGNDRSQAATHLAEFNRAADDILPRIETDMSKQGNALHSAITNVRSHPGNVSALEQDRMNLLRDIP